MRACQKAMKDGGWGEEDLSLAMNLLYSERKVS